MRPWKYVVFVIVLALTSLLVNVFFFYGSGHVFRRAPTAFSLFHEFENNQTNNMTTDTDDDTDTGTLLKLDAPSQHKRHFLTIAIPTVQRTNKNYILTMMDSIFNGTSDSDLKDIIVIVFLADFNKDWKLNISHRIYSRYRQFINMGSLHIKDAPMSYYANLNVTKQTYGADKNRAFRRAKQNFDYAYLMKYSWTFSDYYMQMEDDVVAVPGYFNSIKDFISNQSSKDWVCLEFSELGFIGKLFHSYDIVKLADMFLLFNQEQPVDYTYLYFNTLMLQHIRIIRKPTLFQHIGYQSSLRQEVQGLRDRFIDFKAKIYKGDNPPATVYTTLIENPDFPPKMAYSKDVGYFWSNGDGKENDTFTIIFDVPQTIRKVIIVTGTENNPADIIENGVLRASPVRLIESESACVGYLDLTTFKVGMVDFSDFQSKMGKFKTSCLQILVTRSQARWITIREIAVFIQKLIERMLNRAIGDGLSMHSSAVRCGKGKC